MTMLKKHGQVTYRTLVDGVELGTLVHGEKTLMGRFLLSAGSVIPAHDHPHEQIGLLLAGRMVFTIDGVEHEVAPGDSWCIGSGVSHAARAVVDSVAVEVFSPVREEYL